MSKQKRIPGTYDPPVPAVTEKAEAYAALLRDRMATQKAEDTARLELIDAMKEHDVERVELDDDVVVLEHTEKDRIKVERKKELAD